MHILQMNSAERTFVGVFIMSYSYSEISADMENEAQLQIIPHHTSYHDI